MYRNDVEIHNGEVQTNWVRILTSERNLLPLEITESLYIEKQSKGASMNDEQEKWKGRPGTINYHQDNIRSKYGSIRY